MAFLEVAYATSKRGLVCRFGSYRCAEVTLEGVSSERYDPSFNLVWVWYVDRFIYISNLVPVTFVW